mmetsp:Transcript_58767/g.143753  ORF Transcript_58767/g.143753 Transcript_58767/m.143753 type:complete len:639 (+) Transcript_58767:56-1972(+)
MGIQSRYCRCLTFLLVLLPASRSLMAAAYQHLHQHCSHSNQVSHRLPWSRSAASTGLGRIGLLKQQNRIQKLPRSCNFLRMSSSAPPPKKSHPTALSSASTSVSSFTSFESSASSVISESHKDYTLEALQDYAKKLIELNGRNGGETSTRTSVSIVVAGGGGHAISTLASTSGASSLLLEGVVAYDRNSYLRYCNMKDKKGFVFSSYEAAKVASEAAIKQALTIRSMDDNLRLMPRCIGIGSASALVSGSSSSVSTSSGVKGYGHIVATRSDGVQLSLNVTLKGISEDGTEGRCRMDEDIFLSHLILRSIEHLERNCPQFDTPTEVLTTTTTAGDIITESWSNVQPSIVSASVIEDAARKVVEDDEDAVVLLPVYDSPTGDGDTSIAPSKPVSFRALSVPVIPNQSLVFPGSFNPPHKGHIALANASIRTLERLRPYVHRRHNDKPVFFELSLMNADKPSLDPTTVADRVQKFLQLSDETDNSKDGEQMPQQWGIILTRAPLFAQKLTSLQDCILDRTGADDDAEAASSTPNVNFVIGTDTLVRILNPKYYNNDRDNMISSLLSMKGVHYIVGGRLEQNKDSTEEDWQPVFVSGEDELVGLPEDLAAMFTVMKESEFRVDISSSEIRAAAAAAVATFK